MPDYGSTPFAVGPASDAPPRESLPTNAGVGRTEFRTSVINLERPGDPSVFDAATRVDADELISRYPAGQQRSALLPMLHLVQSVQGQVTPDGIAFCSDLLGLTKAQVSAVATFYTMYKRSPTGEYLVSVCTNTLCAVLGGDEIFAALKDQLGIANNETSADGSITLEHAECLAACDYAPVVTVNYEFFDNQTPESAGGLVRDLQAGARPLPTRGAPLCSFRQIERQIAGFFDAETLAPQATAAGAPTLVGVELAIARGESAPSYSLGDANDSAARSTGRTGGDAAREAAGSTGVDQQEGPSEHDAPLQTAESDPAHPTATDTEKG